MDHGHFYHNDYDAAKLDFACRSGLVRESRQFTDEQLTELYRCIHETLESGYPLTKEREDILRTAAKQSEILQAFGENGNYDVFPIATLDVPEEDEAFSGQEQDQAPGMEMGMAT